jgi:hypothetical protein
VSDDLKKGTSPGRAGDILVYFGKMINKRIKPMANKKGR